MDMMRHVDRSRLLDPEDGMPWKFAGDSALFLPMLEVAKKVKYIKEPLYIYNREHDQNEDKKNHLGASRCSVMIRDQIPNTNNRPEIFPKTEFAPTRRFKLDHGRACNLSCKFCYYLHEKPWRNKSDEEIYQLLKIGKLQGNKMCDISGGEPTISPRLPKWLWMAASVGLSPGIITHGQDLKDKLENLWEHGLQDILFSAHGKPEDHNEVTGTEKRDGFARMFGAMQKCRDAGFRFRTNTVLTKTHPGLPELAGILTDVKPYIANFINFNPYHEWADADKPFMAKVTDIAPDLKRAIDRLTATGTMVNVRYFPFCALKGYEKHIVNMYQVMFDPYEWSYGVCPKTPEEYSRHGELLTDRTSLFSVKCLDCALVGTVCNGVNKVYLEQFGDDELQPYNGGKIHDKFYFRRNAGQGQLYTYVGHNYHWWSDNFKGKVKTGEYRLAEDPDRDASQLPVHIDKVLPQPEKHVGAVSPCVGDSPVEVHTGREELAGAGGPRK